MQRQGRARCLAALTQKILHRVIISTNSGDAGISYPLQQPVILSVEGGTGFIQHGLVRVMVHFEDQFRKPGAQQQDIAFFDDDTIRFKNAHQIIIVHCFAFAPIVAEQINQYTTPLDRSGGKVVDGKFQGTGLDMIFRPQNIFSGPVSIVKNLFVDPVAVGIK